MTLSDCSKSIAIKKTPHPLKVYGLVYLENLSITGILKFLPSFAKDLETPLQT